MKEIIMRIVEVHYTQFDRLTGEVTGLEHVANVYVNPALSVEEALEIAFERTQNLGGSWSRGPTFEDGSENYDYSAAVDVVLPLEEYDGRVYGHRSSMVGDIFEVDGVEYKVAVCGFDKL